MTPEAPSKLAALCDSLHLMLLADRPASVPNLPHQCELDIPKKPKSQDLTCSVIETTVESKESFCPNFKTFFTLYCEKCDKTYIVKAGCKQRTCSFCAANREKKLIWKYTDASRTMQNPKLITLTAPWFKNPRVGKKIMTSAFRRLRQRKPFKYLFKKGLYGFHFKPKPGGMWYVHIHALIDTKYVPQPILAAAWSKCMPGAVISDIRKAWSPKGGLKYILGYITATKHLAGHEDEFNVYMKGTQLVSTTGGMVAEPLLTGGFICPYCGSTSYGYAHKTHFFKKWHNYNRKKTKQEVICDHEWFQRNNLRPEET